MYKHFIPKKKVNPALNRLQICHHHRRHRHHHHHHHPHPHPPRHHHHRHHTMMMMIWQIILGGKNLPDTSEYHRIQKVKIYQRK